MYIGGVGAPFAPLTVPAVLWTGTLRQGYVGCMRDLVINSQPVDIAGYAQQQDSGESKDFFSLTLTYKFLEIINDLVHYIHPFSTLTETTNNNIHFQNHFYYFLQLKKCMSDSMII